MNRVWSTIRCQVVSPSAWLRTSFVGLATLLLLLAAAPRPASAANSNSSGTILLSYHGSKLEGTALSWSTENVIFLGRDGRLWNIDPGQASDVRKLSPTFQSYSAAEMRSQLLREFGRQFEVTGTGHYLVVHPKGQRDTWGSRFEEMYRAFVYYFKSRGVPVAEPQFPLVGIVFPSQQEFQQYARGEGQSLPNSVLGYYYNQSNRVALFDDGNHQQNMDTVIHEVTHQTAYNTGIHGRYGTCPRWIVEGLGTLFEAPGVHDWRNRRAPADRINRGRLEGFRRYQTSGRTANSLAELVASDRRFQENADAAYGESWAFTLFLVETQPQKYSQLLRRTANREDFSTYGSAARTRDFTAVFGNNWALLESHFQRFIKDLK